MKQLFPLLLLVPMSHANAHHVHYERGCFKEVFEERYIRGYQVGDRWITGRVTVDRKKIPIPCHTPTPREQPISKEGCKASATTGGLIGGGLAAAVSEKDAYGWSIPLGTLLGIGINQEVCK